LTQESNKSSPGRGRSRRGKSKADAAKTSPICRLFSSGAGCKYGVKCRFAHVASEAAGTAAAPNSAMTLVVSVPQTVVPDTMVCKELGEYYARKAVAIAAGTPVAIVRPSSECFPAP